jgi:hypothetical protein
LAAKRPAFEQIVDVARRRHPVSPAMLINPRIASAATPSASTLADQIATSQSTRRPHI